MMSQKEKAQLFQALHTDNSLFLLPNAWDPGSAVIYEKAGYKAVATSNAGIAYSLGYAESEVLSLNELLSVVQKIVARISIPLAVDVLDGYGSSCKEAVETVRKVINAGAVGISIADTTSYSTSHENFSVEETKTHIKKLSSILKLKEDLDVPFTITARTYAYLQTHGSERTRLEATIERANCYAAAGADCILIPGAVEKTTIASLTAAIAAPVSFLASPIFNNIEQLQDMGVRKLILGSAPARASYHTLITFAEKVSQHDLGGLFSHPFTCKKTKKFFKL
ncbi:isocitrate lyase/PEP mutase family protein [Halodesulfovibrio spirochaetisodalis]|uniref:2-methylisocitrate lyase n=1 Tax=Halodesulfovibrio spirochaetisodalis TaxID=1560234 RepID=A0A1B7X929_9BACT|nr:isocitrate lyase/phosphoenolpyruvate mutase family protein [Halodesulfovibrio spirochaetisodalis]OBQ45889.1 hypothetical protein SP90_15480 [Halodesulfovibrio spirochaetisodalis]